MIWNRTSSLRVVDGTRIILHGLQRLLQEESDRVALEEHVFVLERRNRKLVAETDAYRQHVQHLQAQLNHSAHEHQIMPRQIAHLQAQLSAMALERDEAHRKLLLFERAQPGLCLQ
jgi:predicted RNase H-like nuclease (RuvC/YqgF family)